MVSNFQDSSPLDNCPDASGDDLKGDSKMNHHDLITIQQITNLVERGKSREEIAELIEVTVGSLQVTCSKLGLSLRQPRLYQPSDWVTLGGFPNRWSHDSSWQTRGVCHGPSGAD